MQALKDAMKEKLAQAGIGSDEINVFGRIMLNVHITCQSRDTADKWVMLLSQVLGCKKVMCTKTTWDLKENKGTSLLPSIRRGYLITAAA